MDTRAWTERLANSGFFTAVEEYEKAHVFPIAVPGWPPIEVADIPLTRLPPQPLKLYVHLPFCSSSCRFCSYVSVARPASALVDAYLGWLEQEADLLLNRLGWARAACSIVYLGGGTPTYLRSHELERLLAFLERLFSLAGATVRCVEASPETLTEAKLDVLREAGVNRLSIGVQSFTDEVLAASHRAHTAAQAVEAVHMAGKVGFACTNIDLIYGLPRQTEETWLRDIDQAIRLAPDSIYLYRLRVNESCGLRKGGHPYPDRAHLLEMALAASAKLRSASYARTRPHAFRRGDAPRLGYSCAPCTDLRELPLQVGLGVSAYSHVGDVVYQNSQRVQEYGTLVQSGSLPIRYGMQLRPQDKSTIAAVRGLSDEMCLDEAVFRSRSGAGLQASYGPELTTLEELGLLECEGAVWRPTEVGQCLAEEVARCFYPRDCPARLPLTSAREHARA